MSCGKCERSGLGAHLDLNELVRDGGPSTSDEMRKEIAGMLRDVSRQIVDLGERMRRVSRCLVEHPDGYDGPCECGECVGRAGDAGDAEAV